MPMRLPKRPNLEPARPRGLRALLSFTARDRRRPAILAAAFCLAFASSLFSSQFGTLFPSINPAAFKAGQVAEQDFAVNRDVHYVDETATRLKQEAAGRLVPPVFRLNEEVTARALERFSQFRSRFLSTVEQERSGEKIFLRMQLFFPGVLDRRQVGLLIGHSYLEGIFGRAQELLAETLHAGLIDPAHYERRLFDADALELWRWADGRLEREVIALDSVLTPKNLPFHLAERMFDQSPENGQLIASLVTAFSTENAFLDAAQTEKHRQKAIAEVEPVEGKLFRGQIIVRRGDLISEEAAVKIQAVGEYASTVNFNSIAGTALYLLVVFCASLFLLSPVVIRLRLKTTQVLFLAAAGVLHLLMAGLLSTLEGWPRWLPLAAILPSSAVSILTAMLISPLAAVLYSIVLAAGLLPIVEMSVYSFLFAALTGVAGTAVVMGAEKRIDLMKAGALLALVDCIVLVALVLLGEHPSDWLLPTLGWGLFNGLACGILSLGLLPMIEHLLNAPTRFRLRELSDLHAPIFKRMLSLAPGTYTHSISVANLAESACTGIRANALLARVGAYYHDIGKIDQAEYFIENQRSYNKHDGLKPSLSAAVIRAHVKIGMEKARELFLPQEVADIISQHHGRGVIKYFYNRALETRNGEAVSVEDYSYPGMRPRSREAAVVMLADAVEAACRTLKRPTIPKLEKVVWNIIMERFGSDELSESSLTLRDLETIQKSFVQVLAGYFHSRIEYPKIKEESARQAR